MALHTIWVLLTQGWIALCFRLDNLDEAKSHQDLALGNREIALGGVYSSSGSSDSLQPQGIPTPEPEVNAHDGGIISVFNNVAAGQDPLKIKSALMAALPLNASLWFFSEVDDKQRCFCATAPFNGDVEFFKSLTLVVAGAKMKPELCQGESLAVGLMLLPKHIRERREKELRERQEKRRATICNDTQRVRNLGTLRNRAKEVISLGIDHGNLTATAKGSAERAVEKKVVAEKVVVEKGVEEEVGASTAAVEEPVKEIDVAEKVAADSAAKESVAGRRVAAKEAAAEKAVVEKVVGKKAAEKKVVAEEATVEETGQRLAEGKATAKQIAVKKAAKKAADEKVVAKEVAEKKFVADKAVLEEAGEKLTEGKATAKQVETKAVAEKAAMGEAGEKLAEGKAAAKQAAVEKAWEKPAAQKHMEERTAAGIAASETAVAKQFAGGKVAAKKAATKTKAAPQVDPTNVLERVHAVLYDQVELASQAVEQLKTALFPGEVTRRVVRYIYNSAKREDLCSMRFEEACDDLVKFAMGSYEAAYGEKEWFFKLDLSPAFAAAAWELLRERQGLRFEEVQAKTRAAFDECLESYMLNKNLWEASISTFKEVAIHKKVYEALQKTHRLAFDSTIMAVGPQQESERVQNFLKLWINESMTKAWNSIEDPESVLTERNVSKLFQNVMLNNRVWGASSSTLKDAAIHNKVYAEVQKAYRPAFDVALREVIPGQELDRVQDFLKHWIGDSMTRSWKSAPDAERVLTLRNVSRVFQNMLAPFGYYDLFSTITKRKARAKKPIAVLAMKGAVKGADSEKAAANRALTNTIEKQPAVGGAGAEKASKEEAAILAAADENLAKGSDAAQKVIAKKTKAGKAAGKKTAAPKAESTKRSAQESADPVAKGLPEEVAPA